MSTGTPYGVPPRSDTVQRDRHPRRARHEHRDAEHLVERAAEHAAVHAARRSAVLGPERAPGAHLDRGRGRSGRRLLGPVDPLDRRCLRVEPSRTGLVEALDPSVGVAHQVQRVGSSLRAEPFGGGAELGGDRGARGGVDVGHHHRFHQLAGRRDQVEGRRRDRGRVGQRVAEQLGDAGGGDRFVHRVDVTQDR